MKRTTLSVFADANPDPESTTVVPGGPAVGAYEVTLGLPKAGVKVSTDAALAAPTATDTGPLTAPEGTVTTSRVAEADVTVAVFVPNETVLEAAVVENPVPERVTLAPDAARTGTRERTDRVLDAKRSTPRRLPAAS
ncbi:hypothetical protein PUR49_34000 [Streptomyces sp. BE147]|nr:hypothetical protein [Streptomyces sp. BE147]MEE1741488.1 hypothetical protein [Streptomyces sp. BE147]